MPHSDSTTQGPNPSGLCMCGCGGKTPLARSSNATNGNVRGEPVRFIPRHYARSKTNDFADMDPNPSGLCMCGCGEKTSFAKKSSRTRNTVAGKPTRYIQNHVIRKPIAYTIDPETGCWNWHPGSGRYGTIWRNGTNRLAHRWMYEQEVGPIPDGCDIHHICRNTRCVNPQHLEPLTKTEHNRTTPRRRLSPESVREIRSLAGKMFHREIAEIYGVSTSLITAVIGRKRWAEVE